MIEPLFSKNFFNKKSPAPEESLYEATKKLINFRIHRLPIVDIGESNTILHIATHYGIISFLMEKVCFVFFIY